MKDAEVDIFHICSQEVPVERVVGEPHAIYHHSNSRDHIYIIWEDYIDAYDGGGLYVDPSSQ